ncbi:MAG TPA: helix-turn-helix transcriptional regulator, partial [Actinomycetota bacterium]|nr:helix-turn-helix transcriptional regulator [Actinomycetota bacterium]
MRGGILVREARRRAGLTQEELARRLGTTQSAIARIERGRTAPSLERLRGIVRACGLDLEVRLVPLDDSAWSLARSNLALPVDARIRQHQAALRFARAAREARGSRAAEPG